MRKSEMMNVGKIILAFSVFFIIVILAVLCIRCMYNTPVPYNYGYHLW